MRAPSRKNVTLSEISKVQDQAVGQSIREIIIGSSQRKYKVHQCRASVAFVLDQRVYDLKGKSFSKRFSLDSFILAPEQNSPEASE